MIAKLRSKRENDEVHQVIGRIFAATNRRGIFVYDRGGDGDNMFTFYIDNGLDFIVRLVGDRNLLNWGGRTKASEVLADRLAEQCALRYEGSILFKSEGKVKNVRVKYGSMPVRLPVRPDAKLHMVVVEWPGAGKPMMLLTTLRAVRTRKAFRWLGVRFQRWGYSSMCGRLMRKGYFDRIAMSGCILRMTYIRCKKQFIIRMGQGIRENALALWLLQKGKS